MYIPHSDPEVDGLFRELSRRCAWTVAFSDSRYICRCQKHGFSLTVATMTKRSQTAGEIRDALIESFHCVGDWG